MTVFQAPGLGREVACFTEWQSTSPPHSSSLCIAVSSQLKMSCGKCWQKNKKDTALINTNTRPWLNGTGSDRERERSWDGGRGSWSRVAFALSQNCITNPTTLWRRQEGKNTCGPRRISIATLKDATSPPGAVQSGSTTLKGTLSGKWNYKTTAAIITSHDKFVDNLCSFLICRLLLPSSGHL